MSVHYAASTDSFASSAGSTRPGGGAPRRSLSAQMGTLGNALKRVLSPERARDQPVAESAAGTQAERSRSRGRPGAPTYKSSGRGGAGNIRCAAAVDAGTFVESVPVAGREVSPSPARVLSTGRGGAGNIRTPSAGAREPSTPRPADEERLVRDALVASNAAPHSSGRGGAGNIVHAGAATAVPPMLRTTSHSRSPQSRLQGRGGAGNLVAIDEDRGRR